MAVPKLKTTKSCIELLTDDVIHDGWTFTIATQKSFYIRGATWFRTHVLSEVTNLKKFADDLENFEDEIRAEAPGWMIPGFEWKKKFSDRQAVDGLGLKKRKPLKFDKAVKALHLCELATERLHKNGDTNIKPEEVYSNMRIEPAVFYLKDFDNKKLEELKKKHPGLLDQLSDECAQTSAVVFSDMASGSTVTKRLAHKTREKIKSVDPDFSIGSVEFRHKDGMRSATKGESLFDEK